MHSPSSTTEHGDGRLTSRPEATARPRADVRTGTVPLALSTGRDGLLYVPSSYLADRPAPLLVALHGVGAHARNVVDRTRSLADDAGTIVLAVDSRATTWDVIASALGPDVAFLDAALAATFERYDVDAKRIAVCGFSDGASYALTLGVANGDLFDAVIAFSPGFFRKAATQGRPRIFVSHGTGDGVLPIDACSRRLVPRMQKRGYAVTYREFDGGHTVPPEILRDAGAWLAAPA